ncbi:MAG TPA: copper amine oxidase N-terminal domain-containing protein, partial [Clostridiales bacterium]|nr:copper amine oxidase N-terminal domain-containing protein [Clostridiales bacterium]
LVVIYTEATKSIPAQTTPQKIIVLNEETAPTGDISDMAILVNGKKIEAEAPYRNEQGLIMVPLRAVAEALGCTVGWNPESRKVVLDQNISLVIGKDQYVSEKAVPFQLGAAPEIIEGRTFVPLDFFTKILHVNNVQVHGSQILIDHEGK